MLLISFCCCPPPPLNLPLLKKALARGRGVCPVMEHKGHMPLIDKTREVGRMGPNTPLIKFKKVVSSPDEKSIQTPI